MRRGRPVDELTDVGNFRIYLQLGQSYLQLGNWTGAEAAGRYAQRLMPNDAGGYMLVSAAVFAAGHHDAAAIQMLAALVLDPANAEAWANLARCYTALGLVPAPIGSQGSNHVLDDGNPVVRRQLVEACQALLRNFETARLPWLAQALREQAVTQYHMSAADLGLPEKR